MSDINSVLKNLDWEHRRPFGWGSSPDADWKVIFVVTVTLIALVSVFSYLMFIMTGRGDVFGAGGEEISSQTTLDIEKLEKTLTYYQGKAAEFRRLTSGSAAVVVDPSL